MQDIRSQLISFFDQCAARLNQAVADDPIIDIEATADAFAESFVEVSPVAIRSRRNGEHFRQMIPRGFEFYRSIGTRSVSIWSREFMQIDDLHWMAKIHWQVCCEPAGSAAELIDFDIFYFIQMADATPKIFAYITGDEQRALRNHGLTPDAYEVWDTAVA
jgi:hypothetical protein